MPSFETNGHVHITVRLLAPGDNRVSRVAKKNIAREAKQMESTMSMSKTAIDASRTWSKRLLTVRVFVIVTVVLTAIAFSALYLADTASIETKEQWRFVWSTWLETFDLTHKLATAIMTSLALSYLMREANKVDWKSAIMPHMPRT